MTTICNLLPMLRCITMSARVFPMSGCSNASLGIGPSCQSANSTSTFNAAPLSWRQAAKRSRTKHDGDAS